MTDARRKTLNEKRVSQLHPFLAPRVQEFLKAAEKRGIMLLVTQAYRTIAEQNALYAIGRSKPGKIVTNARGGDSLHNYRLAIDVAVVDGGDVVWDAAWETIGGLGEQYGLVWGGRWRSFPDYSHFEETFGLTLAHLKKGVRPEDLEETQEAV